MVFIVVLLLCALVIGSLAAYYINRKEKQKTKSGVGVINFIMYLLFYMTLSYAFMVLLYTLFFLINSFK